jgi:exopolyphosphatase/guanosine-5'-triphosphate,3'-diphosphate pyrophosphatase
LDDAAKKAAFDKAAAFVAQAREAGAEIISLAATQACRKALDGAEFVERLGRELHLNRAMVLSGEQEAALSRLGVLSRLEGSIEKAWLADVGGGSTEVLALAASGFNPPMSLPLGAVWLTEACEMHDPPTGPELRGMKQKALELLRPLADLPIKRLVATAGTAATLASLVLELTSYQPKRIDNMPVSREQLNAQLERLAAMPLARRKEVTGLEPERADIILAGLCILDSLLETSGLDRLTAMDAGLLEGILLDAVNRQMAGQ